jgi:hypothetical protein
MDNSRAQSHAPLLALCCALLVAAAGCTPWYDGAWATSDQLVTLGITGESANMTIFVLVEGDTTPRTVSYWTGAANESDAGVVLSLSCSSAQDPITFEDIDCRAFTAEVNCTEEGDDVMSCSSGGVTQRFLRR